MKEKQVIAKKIHAIGAIFLLPILALQACGPSEVKNIAEQKKITHKKENFSPIFYETSKNPTEYLKNDPAMTYQWLSDQIEKIVKKEKLDDEFITTKEKNEKIALIHKTIQTTPPLAFIGECNKKYNADNQEYSFDIGTIKYENYEMNNVTMPKIEDEREGRTGILRIQSETKKDSYIGKNAFGAESTVERHQTRSYAIGFELPKGDPPQFTIKLSLDRENAKKLKDDLACLYSISILPPYLLNFSTGTTATRSDPYEFNSEIKALFGTIEKIAIINKRSGQIYKEYSRK